MNEIINHPGNFVDLTGQRFQSWTVRRYSHSIGWRAYWECQCDCGNIKVMRGDSLRRIAVPYCNECKPRNTIVDISDLSDSMIQQVRGRTDGLFQNTFIIDGSVVFGYTSNSECFIFDSTDIGEASKHTWIRKHFRDGWYVYTTVKGKFTYFHTVILNNLECVKQVDHINRDKLDNRRKNLRFCNLQQNSFNQGISKANTLGYKGLHRHKSGRWNVGITFCQRIISLGIYDTKEEAASVYDAASELLFDKFSWKNRDHFEQVPETSQANRAYVVYRCLKRLNGWKWDSNPEILNDAIARLASEKERLEVAQDG